MAKDRRYRALHKDLREPLFKAYLAEKQVWHSVLLSGMLQCLHLSQDCLVCTLLAVYACLS